MVAASDKSIDPALVRGARAGDSASRAALYQRFSGEIYTLARRILGSDSLAEDVLQEAFVEVFTSIGALREDAAFGGWLRRIAVNRALSMLRSGWNSRRVDWPQEDFQIQPSTVDSHADMTALEAALDALPHTARAVVWLYDVEGYTHREIAEMMGRSVSFSKTRLARAHAALRSMLGDAGPEPADEHEDDLQKGSQTLCMGELKTI